MDPLQSYCTFHLDALYLGIDVLSVQEVIRDQQMTPVPLAPASIRGLMNLRGEIVTALDLRTELELPPNPNAAAPMNVVVRTSDGPVSLLVDRIGDVLELAPEDRETPPDTLAPAVRNIVEHVFKLEDRLLLTLDVNKLLAASAAP